MSTTLVVFKRELRSYFTTPIAYIFLFAFLVLAGIFTWGLGRFYESDQASLRSFFQWHPILYLFLIPALSMRLWSEERRSGTIELLLTLPVSVWEAVLGKFLAAWCFAGIALALTFPTWISVNYLGDPDNGIIVASYLGSFLMGGGILAVGAFVSALTKNQISAFVISAVLLLFLVIVGFPPVIGAVRGLSVGLGDALAAISFWSHFESISKGVLDPRDLFYFLSAIALFLLANTIAVDVRKAA